MLARTLGALARQCYAIDTNVASYGLNGELWQRSPIDLVPYLQILPDTTMPQLRESVAIRRATSCTEWMMAGGEKIVTLTPTVVGELMMAQQVCRFMHLSIVYSCVSHDCL